MAKAKYTVLFMSIIMEIWMKNMVINPKIFGITNINEIKEPIPILFEDNKTLIQLEKNIFNTRKIEYINIAFYKIKKKSKKNTIFL